MATPLERERERVEESATGSEKTPTNAEKTGRSPLKALLFDFGGTLDADGIAWRPRVFRLWVQEAGPISPEHFDAAFYAADDSLVGALSRQTLGETVRSLLHGLCAKLSAPDGAAERIASRFCAEADAHLRESALLLGRLAPRFRLGIVSNFYGNLLAVCEEAGLMRHISVTIDSAALGIGKPDPRIFQAALSALSLGPSDALFVGDSPTRDMAGARGLGMRHVLLSDPTASARIDLCCPDDRALQRLRDLPEIL